jgi:hypothetical protein
MFYRPWRDGRFMGNYPTLKCGAIFIRSLRAGHTFMRSRGRTCFTSSARQGKGDQGLGGPADASRTRDRPPDLLKN